MFNFRVYYDLIRLNALMFQLFMSFLISIIKYIMLFSFKMVFFFVKKLYATASKPVFISGVGRYKGLCGSGISPRDLAVTWTNSIYYSLYAQLPIYHSSSPYDALRAFVSSNYWHSRYRWINRDEVLRTSVWHTQICWSGSKSTEQCE